MTLATDLSPAQTDLLRSIGVNANGHILVRRRAVPLLLLPRSRKAASATLSILEPQTRKARLFAAGLRFSNRTGLLRIFPKNQAPNDESGVLFCNPSHGIRIVVVRPDGRGSFRIVKAASVQDANPLRTEHAAMQRMRGRPGVPDAGPFRETDNAVWFDMPLLHPVSRRIDPVPLLRSWETDIREAAPENGLVRDLLPLLDEPTRVALAGKTVRRALVHGDFAPWNWRADDNGHLVCIDWEWAREDGFAGFDLVYCLVQQALLVKRVRPNRLLPFVERRASRLSPAGQACLREAGLPLDLLVSLVLAYRRSKGMNEPSHGGGTPPSLPRFLAIEGADGVGKSTILRLLVPELVRRGGFNGYLFFHWKPIKSNLSYNAIPGDDPHDPRGKEPRKPLASLVFLAHHWMDFQLGYWRFIRPAIRSGRLVIADRYSYDVLLDPKRFRLKLPIWLLRLFVRTISRPDRAILLHAEPAVIRARKPELSEEEIVRYQTALLACPSIRMPIPTDATESPETIVASIGSQL